MFPHRRQNTLPQSPMEGRKEESARWVQDG